MGVLGWIAYLGVAVIVIAVGERIGQVEGTRWWGIAFLVAVLIMSFRQSIPVHSPYPRSHHAECK